jgi:hypothetical protein
VEYWSDGLTALQHPVLVSRDRARNTNSISAYDGTHSTSTTHDHEHVFILSYDHVALFSKVTENPGIWT